MENDLPVLAAKAQADTVKPVTKRGMGCAETNLKYPTTNPITTPNVFDPEVCYEQCMADATCILAVHDGVNNECTMQTREILIAIFALWQCHQRTGWGISWRTWVGLT